MAPYHVAVASQETPPSAVASSRKPPRDIKMSTNSKKRRHASPDADDSEESTDTKLALLLSLHPNLDLATLLETLLASNGSVSLASASLTRPQKQARQQTSLAHFVAAPSRPLRPPKKGETIHLYTPSSIAASACPLTLHHSFLPAALATSLLQELLQESSTFPPPITFRLFEREVTSPHTSGFFLRDPEKDAQEYFSYQARPLEARPYTPSMLAATEMVEAAVNTLLERLRSKQQWSTNAALVNRYQGAKQAVGWHTDEVTYLGPQAVIAGLSLGVEREFRVRRMNPTTKGDEMMENEGAYAVHLPHNSLVIMHPGMQEGWKHCIHPVNAVDLHPIAGDVRINITYRCYRRSLRPELTPRCNPTPTHNPRKSMTTVVDRA
jgi:alkylated DNA repair dioxygenase AlkB